jgi:hypothetical protein
MQYSGWLDGDTPRVSVFDRQQTADSRRPSETIGAKCFPRTRRIAINSNADERNGRGCTLIRHPKAEGVVGLPSSSKSR